MMLSRKQSFPSVIGDLLIKVAVDDDGLAIKPHTNLIMMRI